MLETRPSLDERHPKSSESSPIDRLRVLAPGLGLVIAGALLAMAVSELLGWLSTIVCAVLIGALFGNLGLVGTSAVPGVNLAAKRVLRIGVVLLGLRLAVGDVLALGLPALLVVASTVTATFFGTQWLGRRLGLSRDLSLLVATGFSICGASAIAAVESSTDADEEEVAAAIGLVTLFGSLAIVVLPLLAGPLGLTDEGFGTWAGASVHDVAQVVAAASSGGAAAVSVAVVVKLTRVVLLAPIVAGVSLTRRGHLAEGSVRPPLVPLFVGGFLAAIGLRSTGWLSVETLGAARVVESALLAMALVALGSGVRIERLRLLGSRPMALGALAWVLVAAVSYLGVIAVVQ